MRAWVKFPENQDCGDCQLCCKLPHINKTYLKDKEFKKNSFEWCNNCEKGIGCKVYKDRPNTCKDFECLFKVGFQKERPNKVGFLGIPESIDGINFNDAKVMTLYCEPHKLSNIIKNINKEHNFGLMVEMGYSFVIRTNNNDKDLWVYEPKVSSELIRPSEEIIEKTRNLFNKNS